MNSDTIDLVIRPETMHILKYRRQYNVYYMLHTEFGMMKTCIIKHMHMHKQSKQSIIVYRIRYVPNDRLIIDNITVTMIEVHIPTSVRTFRSINAH